MRSDPDLNITKSQDHAIVRVDPCDSFLHLFLTFHTIVLGSDGTGW